MTLGSTLHRRDSRLLQLHQQQTVVAAARTNILQPRATRKNYRIVACRYFYVDVLPAAARRHRELPITSPTACATFASV